MQEQTKGKNTHGFVKKYILTARKNAFTFTLPAIQTIQNISFKMLDFGWLDQYSSNNIYQKKIFSLTYPHLMKSSWFKSDRTDVCNNASF